MDQQIILEQNTRMSTTKIIITSIFLLVSSFIIVVVGPEVWWNLLDRFSEDFYVGWTDVEFLFFEIPAFLFVCIPSLIISFKKFKNRMPVSLRYYSYLTSAISLLCLITLILLMISFKF